MINLTFSAEKVACPVDDMTNGLFTAIFFRLEGLSEGRVNGE